MNKTISSDKLSTKIVKIILKTFLILIGALVLFIVGVFATAPIFDKFDHDRFITLDTQMKAVFQQIALASNGIDNWQYEKVCSANRTGWMTTGDYNCLTSISLKKTSTSVEEISNLQAKYYPIISNSQSLKQKDESTPNLDNNFGKNFVVSDFEKHFEESKTGIECQYLTMLSQNIESSDNLKLGSTINNGNGILLISLRCDETARRPWYQLVSSTSELIP